MHSEGSVISDMATLLLRVVTSLMLLVFHALAGVSGAWMHIWQESPWPLAEEAASQGIPSPVMVLATGYGLVVLACLGLLFGLFTRFCAVILIGCSWGSSTFFVLTSLPSSLGCSTCSGPPLSCSWVGNADRLAKRCKIRCGAN